MGRKTNKTTGTQAPVQVEPLLSIPDVMRMLGLGRDTVYRLIHEEGLPSLKLGTRRMVVPSSLAAWVKQREQSGI
jgi:excisionase family DNA binding protein